MGKETRQILSQLPWPGNVRQLENLCRWLTVMASGQEIIPADLPPELYEQPLSKEEQQQGSNWQSLLSHWADKQLQAGEQDILNEAQRLMEKILLERALHYTHGHKQDAAKKLGWGRNTLTRKLKELDVQ